MENRDFCYWLQGFFEITGVSSEIIFDAPKIQVIKDHIDLISNHDNDDLISAGDTLTMVNFVSWLSGVLEYSSELSPEVVEGIEKHLSEVFLKLSPARPRFPSTSPLIPDPQPSSPSVPPWTPFPAPPQWIPNEPPWSPVLPTVC